MLKHKIWFVEKPLTRSKIINLIMNYFHDRKRKIQSDQKTFLKEDKQLSGKKIMIVDDNALNRDILVKLYRTTGAKAIPATSGLDAIFTVETENPDLIIMDYHMPFMNGKECAKKIRDKGIKAPIILLSGDVFLPSDFHNEENQLFDEILAKPINFQVLLKKSISLLRAQASFSLNNNAESPFPLLKNIYNEPDEYKKALEIAKNDIKEKLLELEKVIEKKDYREIKEIAHSLKGTLGYFNSPGAVEILKSIEVLALKNEEIDNIVQLKDNLEKEISNILSKIDDELINQN